jgi:Uma2 family endonuclease
MRNGFDDSLLIPGQARDLAGFRSWAVSPRFPERGRIDFLAGDLEVDMSPEDLLTHSLVKSEIAAVLHFLVARRGLGEVFIDRARISSPAADLSVEPDIVVVLWEALDSGRLRYIPAASGKPGRYIEMEGAPDLVVEILSDSSVRKDLVRLPPLYAAAGVPELWRVDARQDSLRFEILVLKAGGYVRVRPDARGRTRSPRLGCRFRLVRHPARHGAGGYRLEHDGAPG